VHLLADAVDCTGMPYDHHDQLQVGEYLVAGSAAFLIHADRLQTGKSPVGPASAPGFTLAACRPHSNVPYKPMWDAKSVPMAVPRMGMFARKIIFWQLRISTKGPLMHQSECDRALPHRTV